MNFQAYEFFLYEHMNFLEGLDVGTLADATNVLTTPYYPQYNGSVEWWDHCLKVALRLHLSLGWWIQVLLTVHSTQYCVC